MASFARPNLRQAQVVLGKQLARAPAHLADGLARAVRSTPDEGLEQLMRTPVRRAVLEAIFWQLPQHFDSKGAAGTEATIRWRITGRPGGAADTYELQIADGRCRVWRGEGNRDPRLTITLAAAELVRLATGNSDPMNAYFRGRVVLSGDVMLAAKLRSLFRIPGRTQPRQPVRTVSSSR
jgi:putative sterol carrier protein